MEQIINHVMVHPVPRTTGHDILENAYSKKKKKSIHKKSSFSPPLGSCISYHEEMANRWLVKCPKTPVLHVYQKMNTGIFKGR